jgi:ketosteroid isomerase-like protein
MSRENVDIIRRGYERFAAGDLEAVAGLFADEAELADLGGLGVVGTAAGTQYGPEGFLRSSQEALDAFEDYRVEAEEFVDAGDAVVVPVRIFGRGRASGAVMETRLAHVWTFRGGKVIRGDVYRSTAEAFDAVGLGE